jgi:hypothetical protein
VGPFSKIKVGPVYVDTPTRWKNRQDRRLGPLFAERYKAILVEQETYLLELIRYVHLNPLRAGIVDHPDEDRWSSHRAYAGMDPRPGWLDTSFVLQDFGEDHAEQVRTPNRDGPALLTCCVPVLHNGLQLFTL